MPLELGTDNLFSAEVARPGLSEGDQDAATPSNPSSLPHNKIDRESIQTVLQPGRLPGSQTRSDTHHQCVGPQPNLGTSVPTVSAALEGGDRGKDEGAPKGKKHHCGVCGHMMLAVVLAVFSPLIAVGICMADILTGKCYDANEKEMNDP